MAPPHAHRPHAPVRQARDRRRADPSSLAASVPPSFFALPNGCQPPSFAPSTVTVAPTSPLSLEPWPTKSGAPIPPVAGVTPSISRDTTIPTPPRLSMLGAASTSASIIVMPPPHHSPAHSSSYVPVPLPPAPVSFPLDPPPLPTVADPMLDHVDSLSAPPTLPTLAGARRGRCTIPSNTLNAKDPSSVPTITTEIEDTLDLPLPTSSTWLSTATDSSSDPISVPTTHVAPADPPIARRRAKSRRAPSRLPSSHTCLPTTPSSAHSPTSPPSDPPPSYPTSLSLTRRRLTDVPLPLLIPHPTPHAFAALHSLDLSRNRLTAIPAALSDLANLRHLNLAHNHLTHLPRLLCAFEYLESLIVSQNRLTGPLPAWLGYLTHLQVLKVDCNQFTGTVPPAWSALKHLQVLALGSATYGGNLVEHIPEGVFAAMRALRQVDLAANLIQHLPRDLFSSDLPHLATVHVEGNKLDSLPDSIHFAPRLTAVYAANNLLCRLPRSISQCPALEVLDLSGNALCFVPVELIVAVHRRRVTVLLTGNPFTRFHEVGQAVDEAVERVAREEEEYASGGMGVVGGAQEDQEDDAMDVDRDKGGSKEEEEAAEHAVYVSSLAELTYIHPDAIGFNPQRPSPPPTSAYPSPPSTPVLLPSRPVPSSSHPETAATATPPLLRVPISLRELAARKALDRMHASLSGRGRHGPHALAAYLPVRLWAMLESAHGAAGCPRCASPVVGEYLATVEVERVLGHALVPVRKRYCSTECLLGGPTAAEGKENLGGLSPLRRDCCGLGVNCCRVIEGGVGWRQETQDGVLPGAATESEGRPLGVIPANVVRSCLW